MGRVAPADDPDDPYRLLELRRVVEAVVDDDADASFHKSLQHRYGRDDEVTDKDVRIILTIRPETFVATENGGITAVSRP